MRNTFFRFPFPGLRAAALACAALAAPALAADSYPSKPIHMVVGFPPGGSNDMVARIVAPKLGQILGGSVVVENRAGANATIGTEYTARAAPDGYTITLGGVSAFVLSPLTYPNLPYEPLKDFIGVTAVAATPELLAVNPKVPAQTLAELVALSKTREVTVAQSGNGGLPHLAIELLRAESGGRITAVPYKGASPAVTDAVGGHVDGILMDLPALYAMVNDGKLRAIAVTDKARSSVMAGVPTSAEGGLPSVIAFNWFAVFAPAQTPRPIIDTLHAALVKAVADPEVKASLAKLGISPLTQDSPEAFTAFMKQEMARWGKVAKDAGVLAVK